MNNSYPEIIAIRAQIETSISRGIKTPADFDFLSGAIWERTHQYLSPTTLKRTWGYINGAQTIRYSTLNILAQFAGYKDWDIFLVELGKTSEIESAIAANSGIDSRNLSAGQRIEVMWLPNRHCVFHHLGECRFEVEKSENSKLQAGDTFDAVFFVQGEPLYLDNLRQGSKEPVSYLCGNKKGLTQITILQDTSALQYPSV